MGEGIHTTCMTSLPIVLSVHSSTPEVLHSATRIVVVMWGHQTGSLVNLRVCYIPPSPPHARTHTHTHTHTHTRTHTHTYTHTHTRTHTYTCIHTHMHTNPPPPPHTHTLTGYMSLCGTVLTLRTRADSFLRGTSSQSSAMFLTSCTTTCVTSGPTMIHSLS